MQYQTLSESQIEYRVEKAIDRLDHDLLLNKITQKQYDRDIVCVDKWAQQQYDHLQN